VRRASLEKSDESFSIGDPVKLAGQPSQQLFCLGKIRFT
jgi:hypothetical protein